MAAQTVIFLFRFMAFKTVLVLIQTDFSRCNATIYAIAFSQVLHPSMNTSSIWVVHLFIPGCIYHIISKHLQIYTISFQLSAIVMRQCLAQIFAKLVKWIYIVKWFPLEV